jgi:gliding motility-associated-like protein
MKKILISVVFAVGCMIRSQAQIISTFDIDRDGWTAIDSQTGANPTFQSTGGNPGGFIQVVDGVAGTATYYNAPAKFLGDRSTSYGAFLRFDLQVSVTPNSSTAGARLIGGGITLVKLLSVLPAVTPNWTSYSMRLDITENWRVGSTTGPVATEAQIRTVLASLTGLAFNGEYSTAAADGGGLDNVVLESTAPGELEIFTGLSPNGDGENDIFKILNIELRADTQKNKVTILNRWGDVVFETTDYNNSDRVFKGLTNEGKELTTGTYFYKIEFNSGRKSETGYLTVKR